jgi:hypothetical protein
VVIDTISTFWNWCWRNHAPRVAAGRSGLRTEAVGERGQAQRQLFLRRDLLADEVGQRDLGGGDQPATIGGAEQVFGELRQLAGAEGGVIP